MRCSLTTSIYTVITVYSLFVFGWGKKYSRWNWTTTHVQPFCIQTKVKVNLMQVQVLRHASEFKRFQWNWNNYQKIYREKLRRILIYTKFNQCINFSSFFSLNWVNKFRKNRNLWSNLLIWLSSDSVWTPEVRHPVNGKY